MMIHIGPNFYAVPIPTTLGHVKVKVTDSEFDVKILHQSFLGSHYL